MAMTLSEVVAITEIGETEIVSWVEQSWVLPAEDAGHWLFDDADCARIALINDLRTAMGVNDEAVPLVLRLLDQVYALRAALGEIQEAVRDLPEADREALEARLREVIAAHDTGDGVRSDQAESPDP